MHEIQVDAHDLRGVLDECEPSPGCYDWSSYPPSPDIPPLRNKRLTSPSQSIISGRGTLGGGRLIRMFIRPKYEPNPNQTSWILKMTHLSHNFWFAYTGKPLLSRSIYKARVLSLKYRYFFMFTCFAPKGAFVKDEPTLTFFSVCFFQYGSGEKRHRPPQ